MTESALYPPAPLALNVRCFKRTVDVLFGLASIIFPLAPLLLINWLYNLPRGGGSPLVSEPRVGMDGVFAFYKLRIDTRPRTTRKGKFIPAKRTPLGETLRHWGIDETAQAINILVGNMSLVGPRPVTADEHDEHVLLDPTFIHRYAVRPGLFGLAIGIITNTVVMQQQLVGAWHDRHALDLQYIREWTLRLELRSCRVSIIDMIHGHDPT